MAASSPAEVGALAARACGRAALNECWHALAADDVLRQLGVRAEHGLTQSQVETQRQLHGANSLPEAAPRPAWRVFARQFTSPLIYILFAAALMAVVLGHHSDAGVILAVVLANALIGMFQEGRAERSMAALRRLAVVHVRVLRDGHESMVEARYLVPGDIILLTAGDAATADARLVEDSQLHAAEAALTGESLPVSKSAAPLPEETSLADRRNMVYSGTYITAGRAVAVVVATGRHTEVGRIAALTQAATEPRTPLQERLGQLGRILVAAAFALFVLVVLLGMWRSLPLSEVLMVAISQMVSMVPEGLPVAMTIALAVGMQRMAARGVIIRRLSAVETLGSTTVICTDKTGTLTRNEMTVTALWLPAAGSQPARRVDVSGVGYSPQGELSEAGARADAQAPALASLLKAAVLCNDSQLLPPEDERTGWAVVGDPTEGALLVLAAKAGIDFELLRRQLPRDAELPFDSDAKLMATRHKWHGAQRRVIVKGAPEAVLRLCRSNAPEALREARQAADAMAAQALRVLAFAGVDGDPLDPTLGFDGLAGKAQLIGLAGQIDPPRDEARAAVADCRAAGIRPVMVTGDHKLTGLAIARALGIAREGDRAIDGTELERMGEAELRDQLPAIAVFARVQPAQKLRIVEALQARGEVVAMTGDGVNDAPALAQADVGVAMGVTGTEVAKSAARIVITDDNFATIVRAVEQGRVVYGNLKKVILYLFATSIDEVALLLLALLAGYPIPLAAVQILWINIVTEGTLTVNLVMQPPDGDEMQRKPVPRNDPLLDRGMLQRVALMVLVTVTVTFGWFAWRMGLDPDLAQVRTETFTLLAMCQWFNVLNCQSPTRSAVGTGTFRNRWLMIGLALSILLQIAVVYVPVMNTLFHTVALPVPVVLLLAALAGCVLAAEELRKRIGRGHLARRLTAI